MRGLIDFMSLLKECYWKNIAPVCEKYRVTAAEFDIVMLLGQAADLDTATELVRALNIAKSQVSMSIKHLEERDYIIRTYKGNNRRTIHLKLCEAANALLQEGKVAQENFFKIALKGYSAEDIERISSNIRLMSNNIREYLNC